MSAAALLEALAVAGVKHLTPDLRRDLATAGHEAVHSLRRFAEAVEGLGCLIAYDAVKKTGAGNFQDGDDVAGLLFAVSHVIDVSAGLILAGEVAGEYREPEAGPTGKPWDTATA